MGVAYSTNELAHIATRNLIGTALTDSELAHAHPRPHCLLSQIAPGNDTHNSTVDASLMPAQKEKRNKTETFETRH